MTAWYAGDVILSLSNKLKQGDKMPVNKSFRHIILKTMLTQNLAYMCALNNVINNIPHNESKGISLLNKVQYGEE